MNIFCILGCHRWSKPELKKMDMIYFETTQAFPDRACGVNIPYQALFKIYTCVKCGEPNYQQV